MAGKFRFICNPTWSKGGRATIIACGLLLAGVALFLLGHVRFGDSQVAPIGLVTLVGFLMIGPYSYFAGAIALDLGGKQGGATTSGIIVGVAYLGGILAGDSIARLSIAYGWRGAFTILAVVVWLSSIAAFFYGRSRNWGESVTDFVRHLGVYQVGILCGVSFCSSKSTLNEW